MDSSSITIPSDPHLRRWMLFVDGENLTFRAQRLAGEKGIPLREGPYYMRDVMVWFPEILGTTRTLISSSGPEELQRLAVRACYYTSTIGSEDVLGTVKDRLWRIGFQPMVFKKPRTRSTTKGVDVALTTDLLSNAYRDNYDSVVLFAGDGDYVPLIEDRRGEAARQGRSCRILCLRGSRPKP